MQRPTISVAATTGLLAAIADAGANPDHVLRAAGVRSSLLENPDAFIATADFLRTLEEAALATGDRCFGLHFGERFEPRDIGALAYAAHHSPTGAVAMRNIERYIRIHNSAARVSFNIEGERAYLRYSVSELATEPVRQHNEYSMILLVKTFEMIAGKTWKPLEIQFGHQAPARRSEHSRLFRCAVKFGCATNVLIVARDFVERLVPLADPRLYRILKQQIQRTLNELPPENDWLGAVRKAIADALSEGNPQRENAARKLGMSAGTLERRLREHGLAYRQIVEAVRRQFALSYLGRRTHTLTEIAFLLGYSEVSALHRAFKRWTGSTPSEYRKQNAR